MKTLLHVGCGSKVNKPPRDYAAYKELRLDVNKLVEPDIVSSIVAMPMVDDASVDAVLAVHVMEHLYAHEVAMALAEFFRVLKPGGILQVQVPDLQTIGGRLAADQAGNLLYYSAIGHISALDMLYGYRGAVGSGNLFMAHKTGFTQSVLKNFFHNAGFDPIEIDRSIEYELKVRGLKPEVTNVPGS